MVRRGFRAVVNYLDDFLIIGSTKEECQRGLVTLINLLHYLGFNVSWRKVVSPTQRITFLGIELDYSSVSLRLPEDKLNRLIDLVNTSSHKASASKRQLQSLAGSLNFVCQVVRGGRTFYGVPFPPKFNVPFYIVLCTIYPTLCVWHLSLYSRFNFFAFNIQL